MEKDTKIKNLNSRIDDFDQHTRMDHFIISGLETRNFADVAKENGSTSQGNDVDQNEEDVQHSQEEKVVGFFQIDMGVEVVTGDISVVHYLQKGKGQTGPKNIVVKFVRRNTKDKSIQNTKVLRHGRNLKGKNIYVNEHLSETNAELHRRAREMKKKGIIEGVWSKNCRVCIKLKNCDIKTIFKMADFVHYGLEN